jgi:PAS fold
MFIAWGEHRIWLYNDSFAPILGDKHPCALGRPAVEVWAEAKDTLEPMFDRVFSGEPFYMEDFSLGLERNRRLAEAHFSFSYTPVRNQEGAVAGLFGTCIETTVAVVNARLLAKSEERLQLALSAGNSVGTWDWDVPADECSLTPALPHSMA